jgi:hypothetical protein
MSDGTGRDSLLEQEPGESAGPYAKSASRAMATPGSATGWTVPPPAKWV